MEPAWTQHEFEREEEHQSCDIERRLVCEDGVAFDAFESQNCAAELNLGCSVVGDLGECAAEHRNQDGQEKRVAKEGESDHESRADQPVEFDGFLYPGPVKAEPYVKHPFRDGDW